MKLRFLIILIISASTLSAMQPVQWIRNASQQTQEELTAEEATRELLKILSSDNVHIDINKVRQLIAAGADVNARDARGLTPLIHAIDHESFAVIHLLLENGASADTIVQIQGQKGTALDIAVSIIRPSFVSLLLQYGADPNNVSTGVPPLFTAIVSHRLNPTEGDFINEIIRLLLEYGANPNTLSNNGMSALELAISTSPSNADITETVRLLLQAGANPSNELEKVEALIKMHELLLQIENRSTENDPPLKSLKEIQAMLLNPEKIQRKGFKKVP